MVQLKVTEGVTGSYGHLFQFLMVQLKVVRNYVVKFFSEISIPYGSIKSSVVPVCVPRYHISIPYGSIKSVYMTCICCVHTHFNSLWFN